MIFKLAFEFLLAGYPCGNSMLPDTDFIALSCGGKVPSSDQTYSGLGLSKLISDVMNKSDNPELQIEPHFVLLQREEGIVVQDYQISSQEMLIADWHVATLECDIDPVDWKPGSLIKSGEEVLEVVSRDDTIVAVRNSSGHPIGYRIIDLYVKGFRLHIPKEKLN